GVVLLERHPGTGQCTAHLLNLVESRADTGAPELDREAGFPGADTARDVVGLHFLGAAPDHARGFVRYAGIGERPAHDPRPFEVIGLERGRGTDVGLGLEPRTEDFHEAPDGTNRPWRQLLLAQPVV